MIEPSPTATRGPILFGPRVFLRPWTEQDFNLCLRWFSQREVQRVALARRPWPWTRMGDHLRTLLTDPESEQFVVALKATSEPIGLCGLFALDEKHKTAEVGLVVGEPFARRKGYGTEALELLMDHAFRTRQLEKLFLHVYSANLAAVRLYEKAGFRTVVELGQGWLSLGKKGKILVMEKRRSPGPEKGGQ